jgi:alpha-ketoglutarate-dependent 2,4-dichlorophenoxyacetate dioxygenase
MALTLRPLHPVQPDFAAEADGIDLRRPLDAGGAAEIEAAMDRFAVLVFRDQPLEEEQQLAFTKLFGPIDKGLNVALPRLKSRFKNPELIDISNVAEDETIRKRDDRRMLGNLANQLWHSDSSFKSPPAKYSILAARVVPAQGGDTEWADERAAYDALPEATKKEIDGLVGEHFALHSRRLLADLEFTEEERKALPPVRWPLVRAHPSGRKTLFIGVHVTHVLGMTVGEGRLLLQELLEHATQPRFVYRHRWRVGDVVMWDNRCVLHRGRRYDLAQRRELRRSTTEDVASRALGAVA